MSAFAAHFTSSQHTQASSAAAASNPDVNAQHAPQATAGKRGDKPAKHRPIGLRKRPQIVCHVCSGLWILCISFINPAPLCCVVSARVVVILILDFVCFS